jgi:hypothetical protein
METPVTTPRDAEFEQRVRQVERTAKKEHLKATLALEERFEKLLAEKTAQIQALQDMLSSGPEQGFSRFSSSATQLQSQLDEGAASAAAVAAAAAGRAIEVENSTGFGLPDSVLLGATAASTGPIVSSAVTLEPVGTVYEMDRVFQEPAQVRSFFRELFPWGPLDQPWRCGKHAYLELMDAFATGKHRFVHLHFRVAAVVRASLAPGARFSDSYLELLDALRTAGRPSDFDLFVLDCGGSAVVSTVVAGGAFFLLTFPPSSLAAGEAEVKPWRLARVGSRRFQMMVCGESDDAAGGGGGGGGNGGGGASNAGGSSSSTESRMLKCPIPVLEGALSVLLKMHVNLTAFPGQARYTQVPIRSKVFARVASVEGAAEFLVEHGWADDGNSKIVFQGSGKDVDRAVEALERMTNLVSRKKERTCTGLVVVEGGALHGSCMTWDEWRAGRGALYRSWLLGLAHRSRLAPVKASTRELHHFVPPDHPLRGRLRATVAKGLVQPPAITDMLFVCADNMGTDLMLRIPHGYVAVARQVREDRALVGQPEDLTSLPAPPRERGHRAEMVLCYKAGSTAARLPVSGLRMGPDAELTKVSSKQCCRSCSHDTQ